MQDGKQPRKGGRVRMRTRTRTRIGIGIGVRTMMLVFHSATFSCSYFSAEPRAASMVWVVYISTLSMGLGGDCACIRSGR